MSDRSNTTCPLAIGCAKYVSAIRRLLLATDVSAVDQFLSEGLVFKALADSASTDSFSSIIAAIETLLRKSLDAGEIPSSLEREMLDLAADWLEQLSRLYSEALPEPRALVRELLYTFELVERSNGAVSLPALLLEEQGKGGCGAVDPFESDPEPVSKKYNDPDSADPFADDPGFGMEFDLLERTLTMDPSQVVVEDDLFTDDDHFDARDAEGDGPHKNRLPFDVFGDDPEPEGQ